MIADVQHEVAATEVDRLQGREERLAVGDAVGQHAGEPAGGQGEDGTDDQSDDHGRRP